MNVQSIRSRRAALATVAALGLLTTACKRGKEGDARAESAPAVTTLGRENIVLVKEERVQSGPAISGSLAPEREAAIRAQVAGPVLQTYVEQGQRVAPGQVLARLDDSAIRDSYLSARSGVTSAQSSADLARRQGERMERLLAAGAIAESDAESARRADVAAQAALADAKARLASASQQLERTRITAPFAGVVSERQVSAGDVVQTGGAMFTVVEPSSMRLEASVPAEQLSDVRVGMPVMFTVSGYQGRTFAGRVTRVSPVADPVTRQVRIIASIPNPGSTLVGGLFAEGRVASQSSTAPVVPATAVDERGLRPVVIRVRRGKAEKTEVQLGIRDQAAETVEVRAGLAAGDTVLVGAARGISPGTPVRVVEVTDQSAAQAEQKQ